MTHSFSNKQLLNITTGRLYTSMDDIYDFFDLVIGPGFMTHMLPYSRKAILPILKEKLPDMDYEKNYNPDIQESEVNFTFTNEDKEAFWKNYNEL